MIENFAGLNLKGKIFQDETKLSFFDKDYQLCLIYGKNGSGKSTISKAFYELKNNSNKFFTVLEALDRQDRKLDIAEFEKSKIFVFNEEYINDKIKIKDDGLDAIVLFGKNINLDKKLEKIDKIYRLRENKSREYETNLKKYNNENILENYKTRIIQTLKSGFATRQTDINLNKRRNFENCDISYAENNIINKYNNKINEEYLKQNFNIKSQEYKTMQNSLNFEKQIKIINFQDIQQLLAYEIKQTTLNEKEEQIKQIIKNNDIGSHVILNIIQSDSKICPYCLQKLTNEYKKELLSSLENIFNPQIQQHKSQLENVKIQNLSTDLGILENMKNLDFDLYNKIISGILEYEKNINLKIDEKINNPFKIVILEEKIYQLVDDLNKDLIKFEEKRQKFQERRQKANEIRKELEILNHKITYHEIVENFKKYKKEIKIKDTLECKNEHNHKRLEYINKKKEEIQAKKNQINIAQDKINKFLKYIFFKTNRLELNVINEQNKYILKSNSNSVKASDVSVGERNAIALSYFFTEIFAGEDEDNFYKNQKFIVIDDPISSFDFENKVGIMSFLNYQIQQILHGNKASKIIILTHDLMSMFDMQKMARSVFCNEFLQKELKNKQLDDFGYGKNHIYSEYQTLLIEICNYAIKPNTHENINIGNAMRKVLESFATFNYKCGIAQIATDDMIVCNLNQKQKDYFKNLMYRLVLNGESHYEEKIKNLDFFSYVDEYEKQKTAQNILSLLYLLNGVHLQKYLENTHIEHIKEWVKKCEI